MKLSKTNFLIYRDCAHNAWVKMHKPEVYRAKPLSVFDQNIIETGNEVDDLARGLFPGGAAVERAEFDRTMQLVKSHQSVIYQAAFQTDRYVIACDILIWNGERAAYDLYEVKASTSGDDKKAKDELYTYEIGFQTVVLRDVGVPLGKQYLVRLNSQYVRGDTLDLQVLFTREDFTERVEAILGSFAQEMATASDVLQSKKPLPSPCQCIYKGRSSQCTTFDFSNPTVPGYSVHHISRIGNSKARLRDLVDRNILAITDVPDEFDLSDKQRNQVRAAKTNREVVDTAAIAKLLDGYGFPLAFFDYETYAAGVPRFAGYRPFDHIPFQFSLDVMGDDAGPVEHHEFLFTERCCPDHALIAALRQSMPASGSIVTWNKSFEMTINKRLAERNPQDTTFIEALNARVVDLMEVFSSQAYVHPAFRGSTSIKAVLPALVPDLSYKTLEIQEGGSASDAWNRIVTGNPDSGEVDRVRRALLTYCGLDTRAMWEIWRMLSKNRA